MAAEGTLHGPDRDKGGGGISDADVVGACSSMKATARRRVAGVASVLSYAAGPVQVTLRYVSTTRLRPG